MPRYKLQILEIIVLLLLFERDCKLLILFLWQFESRSQNHTLEDIVGVDKSFCQSFHISRS